MTIAAVTLDEVLCARDTRVSSQRRLLGQYGCPVVSFTMNIPGPVKKTPLAELAFDRGLKALEQALGAPLHSEIIRPATGCEALLVYRRPAPALKETCLALEASQPVGRLYDLDVLDVSGEKLSRPAARTCLVCGGPVTVCSRSRAHGLEAVTAAAETLLADFAAGHLSQLARSALAEEVLLTPKPGLVDRCSSGAHEDMNLALFLRSADALTPFFREMVQLGLRDAPLPQIRSRGMAAEETMFAATGGVNTHKGALYSFSLLLCAAGRCLRQGGDLFEKAAALAQALAPPEGTHGAAVRSRYGVGGVRAEALAGFPTARRALTVLKESGALTALLWLMAHTEDSNLYYRGGAEGAAFVRTQAAAILAAPVPQRISLTLALDAALTARRLSPGGCADLLALALFLQALPPVLGAEGLPAEATPRDLTRP